MPDRANSQGAPTPLAFGALWLVLSGLATLTYQVTWVRLLGLSLGSTSASVATVLAAFFLGMAAGSYLAERILQRGWNALSIYLALELVIGLAGALLLPVLLQLDEVLAGAPAVSRSIPGRFALVMALFLVPTTCMGATFPVLATVFIRSEADLGRRLGLLYGWNTAGAVLGAFLSGFVLIPRFGVNGAVGAAAALNALIAASCAFFARRTRAGLEPLPDRAAAEILVDGSDSPLRTRALCVLFGTGFVSIATEVGWTKYLAVFTGTTIYGFSAILTAFLLGMALGSFAVKPILERVARPSLWLACGLLLVGASLFATRSGLAAVPALARRIHGLSASGAAQNAARYGVVLALLFAPTFLFGALFPLSLKVYCGPVRSLRDRVGKAYAVNTFASILGSLAAGFWLIPRYGTDFLLAACAAALILLALVFLPLLGSLRSRIAGALLALGLIAAGTWLPPLDFKELISSVGYTFVERPGEERKPTFLFVEESKSGVISVVTYDGLFGYLQSNGLQESALNLKNPDAVLLFESLLGLVPYLIHPDPESAFVVGFGGGTTARSLFKTPLESIRVVELEPAVVDAVRSVSSGSLDLLADSRVDLEFNDARNTLLVERESYDLIVSQPSHPWLAGAGKLFTTEFFEIVRSRLHEDGIFVQWLNLFCMDEVTLQSILQALYGVFPHGFLMASGDSQDLLLVASPAPLRFDLKQMGERMSRPWIRKVLSNHGILVPEDLLRHFCLSRAEALEAAGAVPANRDARLFSEVRLTPWKESRQALQGPMSLLQRRFSLDVLPFFDPDTAAEDLHATGLMFARFGWPSVARLAARRLSALDPERSQDLLQRVETSSPP